MGSNKLQNDGMTTFIQLSPHLVSLAVTLILASISPAQVLLVFMSPYMCGPSVAVQQLKQKIIAQYPCKDLGNLIYCLGLEILRNRNRRTLTLHQTSFLATLLKDCNLSMLDRPVAVPRRVYSTFNQVLPLHIPYRSLVGRLLYLAINTRPDIAEAVGYLARHQIDPQNEHWFQMRQLIRYLSGTNTYGLVLGGFSPLTLMSYCDADHGGCWDTGRSTSGYSIFLGTSLVQWRSQLQSCPVVKRNMLHCVLLLKTFSGYET
jgi:hypothetical protein